MGATIGWNPVAQEQNKTIDKLKRPHMTQKNYPAQKFTIKTWAEEDRPREKLMLNGKHNLTNAELLAILIGSGNTEETAVELCRRILNYCNDDLDALAKMSVSDFTKFKGIGEAKAITIVAALELSRRKQTAAARQKPQILSSKDIFELMSPRLCDLPHEEFWVLYLNHSNKVISEECISIGGIAGTVADVKIILKKAIEKLASAIILVHNHPSGNLQASHGDIKTTRLIKDAAALIEVRLLDHIIVADEQYYSFADHSEV